MSSTTNQHHFLKKLSIIPVFVLWLIAANTVVAQEVCTDGIDNDQDGYIDYYDKDCECDEEFFNAQCPQECVDTLFENVNMKLKWRTDVLNIGTEYRMHGFTAFDSDAYLNSHNAIAEGIQNIIVKIDLNTGDFSHYLTLDTLLGDSSFEFLIHKENAGDPLTIFTKNLDQDLLSLNETQLNWKLSGVSNGFSKLRYIKAADFDQNGTSEIYTGNSIVSSNGQLLYKGQNSEGCNFFSGLNTCFLGASSIAMDFTDNSGLELACGNVVYELNLLNKTDSVGNTANLIFAPEQVLDGYTGVGDFDEDGFLEVVSSRSNGNSDGGIWIWSPREGTVLGSYIHGVGEGLNGSVPIVSDIDNDCIPEIIITHQSSLSVYSFDGISTLGKLYSIPIEDQSGYTIPTVFDLNSDGISEIVFRDEMYLYILDGPSGAKLDSFPILSSTLNEQPIITDGDGDGHAEILIQGSDDHPDSLRLFCFESANKPWAPARRVWNQTGYHVTNVNDDLTIPQYQQNSAAFFDTDSCLVETCPQVYNSFGVQATYRTQKGCRVYPEGEADLQVTADYTCEGDSIAICLHAIATDTSIVRSGVTVSCYAPPTFGSAVLLDQVVITQDTTCITYAHPKKT